MGEDVPKEDAELSFRVSKMLDEDPEIKEEIERVKSEEAPEV